jgi:Berberine and berberine like
MLILPATPQVIAGFVAAAQAAPEELSTIANVMAAPPLPFLPPDQHGRLVVLATLCYAGHAAAGQRALAPFRALAAPLADQVRPMPYPAMYPPEEAGVHPSAVVHTRFLDHLGGDAAATILEHLQTSDAPVRVAQLRVLGGAMARVPADATAFAHRGSPIMATVVGFSQGPADKPGRQGWLAGFAAALGQGDDGAYTGFLGEDGSARVHQAYPGATWDRLVEVKARYDPTNLFRHNHNIPAAG